MISLQIYHQVTNPQEWEGTIALDKAWLEDVAILVFREVPLAFPPLELSFLFTDDETIRTYNRDYRGKDQATNVLSFPSYAKESPNLLLREAAVAAAPSEPLPLGDVALAFQTIEREARAVLIPFDHHLTHLLVHGILHLLGYDHEEEEEAIVMEALEVRILSHKRIPNPYKSCKNSSSAFLGTALRKIDR